MEIDTIAEWDAICRICLQEGQLHSLFYFDDEKSELNIAEKIMLCSPILVRIFWAMPLKSPNSFRLFSLSKEGFIFVVGFFLHLIKFIYR